MAYDGLNWQKVELPFAAGLNQRADDRARPQPFLDICRDVQFDELGGLQTRFPFGVMSNSIFGGGTLSNCRRIDVINDELVVFTDTAIYSWNAQLTAWVLRDTHLAVSVTETQRCVSTGDQVDADRAELNGTIVYAWTEGAQVYAEALDKTTGSVLASRTAVSTAQGRPRLVALATKILLFTDAGSNNLTVRAIDPAAPGTAISGSGSSVLASNYNAYYDVVRAGTQDLCVGACRRSTTTSYTVFTVTPALSVTTSTKARTADGPLAVATIDDGTQTQIVRGNGNNVQGDLLTTSTLADVFTGQALGSAALLTINHIVAAFVSTTCRVFWSLAETATGALFSIVTNTVTTSNSVGSSAGFNSDVGIASRAFAYNGNVYLWTAFGSQSSAFGDGSPVGLSAQLQNTYFLYRSDGRVVAKAVWQTGGGLLPNIGQQPGVAAISGGFAWAAGFRRSIPLGNVGSRAGVAQRSPVDVAFAFDNNGARRCARIGRTLYISGGFVAQYDGVRTAEVGFFVYPWNIAANNGSSGNLTTGTYSWKMSLRWTNAQGERERSTTASATQAAMPAADFADITGRYLNVTNKLTSVPNMEIWRTLVNSGEPYYLATSQDPAAVGDNAYLANVIGTGISTTDNYSDTTIAANEPNPENGDVLENLAPPGASIILATDTRVFLAGVSGDPDRVWPSKLRNDGEIAAWHDSLPFPVPRPGGDITALWFDENGILYVARETAIYAFSGPGPDNTGSGSNFQLMRIVSDDVGAISQETVARTPLGTVFKSSKGWYLLTGSGVEYIGDKVTDFDADTVYAVNVVETQHQVRILTSARMIVWDYLVNQWGEWTISDGVHATIWNGQHVYLTATGPKLQQTTYSGISYGMDIETAWIKLAGLQGALKVRELQPLGEYRGAHKLRFRVAYNYQASDSGGVSYLDDKSWAPSPTTVGGPLNVSHGPKRPKCGAIKLRLTAENADGTHTAPTTESLKLTNLALDVGIEPGTFRRLLPAAQRQ